MENQLYAMWSLAGKSWETMNVSYKSDSDVPRIHHIFRLLTNVTKANINLSISLTDDESLQESKQDIEDVMI